MNQNEKRDDSNKKDGLDIQLESSFQSSFRSTSTHLKVYDPSANAEIGARGASGVSPEESSSGADVHQAGAENQKIQSKQNVRDRSGIFGLEPPAARHAPHHSWLLGSHGGKKKPQAVRTRDGLHIKTGIDSATLAGLFSPGTGAAHPGSGPTESSMPSPPAAQPAPEPPIPQGAHPASAADGPTPGRIGEHPDDYRMPPNAKGALPPENYEQPDLYAATVEVNNPVASNEHGADSEPFDQTVAHLYSQTVDVNKPGKLTRFPEESLHPESQNVKPAGTTNLDSTSPPKNIVNELAPSPPPQFLNNPTLSGQPNPTPIPAASPPRLPPPRPLSQFQSGVSHAAMPPKLPPNLPPGSAPPTQFQSSQAHSAAGPQAQKSESRQAGWTPYFDSKDAQQEPSSSASTSPSAPNKKASPSELPQSSQSTSSSKNPPLPETPPANRKGSSKTSSSKDSADTGGDGKSRGQRKRGMPSYIDRQIGSVDEQASKEDEDDVTDSNGGKKGSPVKTVGIALVAVIAFAIVGVIAYEGINSGGRNWIPAAGSGEWKKFNAQAETAMSHDNYEEAIGYLDQAIKLNSGQAVLYHRRGLAKLRLQKEDKNESALRDLDTALKKDPKLLEAMLDRAAVRIELGHFDQAVEDYDRLIKAGKDTDKVHYGRGLAKYYAGEYAEAEREFKNILKASPDNAQAAIALGTTLYASKSDKKGAEEQFTKAAEHDKSGLADRNLGILSYENGPSNYQDAKKFYNDAIDDTQTDANIYNERGVISWLLKNPLDATTDFRHAIGLDPTLDAAVRNLEFVGKASMDADPKSAVALSGQIEINLLKKNWAFAVLNADRLIEVAGWKSAPAYDGVLLKWVALNLDGKGDKSQEVLRDCKMNAGSFPWPMPLVRYLYDDKADFSKLEAETFNHSQRTTAHYYAGMKDYFNNHPQDAKKRLEWVIEQGAPSKLEYPLAGKALALLAAGGAGKEENK